jgi:hypothetical protein
MAIRTLFSSEKRTTWNEAAFLLKIVSLVFMLAFAGNMACSKGEEAAQEEGLTLEEGIIQFEGTVKVAVQKYVFIPEARGFDIIVQGDLSTGDTSTLVGKEVKGEGEVDPDIPSVLIAKTLDVKDESGEWSNVFTLSEEASYEDYLSLKEREEFQVLENLAYNKNEGWEGKERAKVYGQIEKTDDSYKIVVLNEEDSQVGKIIVDNYSDFGLFYLNKLRLFEKFWFYVNVKDTVSWGTRRRTRELFHADVLLTGLF